VIAFRQLPTPETLGDFVDAESLTVWDLIWALFVVLLAFLLARIARRALRPILHRLPNLSSEGALVISRATGWVIILLGIVYAMVIMNVDMGPALIVVIIIGIVVFFAGRGIVENFSSGLVLQASPMFGVGDQIVTGAGTGIVKEVTGRTVRIQTMDGEAVYIPNKVLINEPITNLTDLGTRRSTFHVGVRYGTDVALAARVLEEAAASCDTTHRNPPPEALISGMGDHAIEFMLRFWHHPGILESERAKDAVGRAIDREFASRGIVIAFPQLTMWWGADAGGTSPDG